MKTENKLKFGIGTAAFLLIAIYVCFVFLYGSFPADGIEYVINLAITAIITAVLIFVSKNLTSHGKGIKLFLTVMLLFVCALFLRRMTAWYVNYRFSRVILSLWPLFCYAFAKHVNVGKKIGFKPFVFDCVTYNAALIAVIWIVHEVIFKIGTIPADIISEAYMYIVAVLTYLLYSINVRKIKWDRWNVIVFVATVAVVAFLWVNNQDRILEIRETFKADLAALDSDGEFVNWLSHRKAMLQAFLSGDFSVVNTHRVYTMMKICSVAHLSGVGGMYVTVVLALLSIALSCLMIIYAVKSRDTLTHIVTICFIVKFIIGFVSNVLLIFSSDVLIPLINNMFDIVPLIMVFYYRKSLMQK